MIIKISYESKYSLSTVKDGENILTGMAVISENPKKEVKHILKKDKSYLENIKELNKYYPNYQYADITKNTVIGILCRLVGEVRRVDSLDQNHPIISLENFISFENKNVTFQNEIVLLHTALKEVQNNAAGVIPDSKSNHFLLSKNTLSETLMSVFNYKTQEEILKFLNLLLNNDPSLFYNHYNGEIKANTFVVNYLNAEKNHGEVIKGIIFNENENTLKEIGGRLFFGKSEKVQELEKFIRFSEKKPTDIKLKREQLEINEIYNIWGFLFSKKISFLTQNNLFKKELSNSLNRDKTSIKGLAPNSASMTIKDFYSNFVTDKKTSWSMPYSVDLKKDLFSTEDIEFFNKDSKVGLTKESGELIIKINVPLEQELDIYKKIENAGVNTFHMGKKGLAYVSDIILEKI